MTATDGLDIRQLLDYIAAHDGRKIGLVAVSLWTWQAAHGCWTREAAMNAAIEHYAAVPPVCWDGTDQPRPLLPADVNQYLERKGQQP
jgi:hypothetical protein